MSPKAALAWEVEYQRGIGTMPINPRFGSIYGDAGKPSFITDAGVGVWMWRKGQRVRFFTAEGVQVGPEHRKVFPAIVSAYAAGWIDRSEKAADA